MTVCIHSSVSDNFYSWLSKNIQGTEIIIFGSEYSQTYFTAKLSFNSCIIFLKINFIVTMINKFKSSLSGLLNSNNIDLQHKNIYINW